MQDRLASRIVCPPLSQDRQKQVDAFPDEVRAVKAAATRSRNIIQFFDHLIGKAHRHLRQIHIAHRRIWINGTGPPSFFLMPHCQTEAVVFISIVLIVTVFA